MKKSFVLVFVLAALILSLAMPLGSVIAAGKTATLVEFKHVEGKGWTLVFKINGDWKHADLKGNTIKVGSNTYPLSCNFRDENHVSCTMQVIGQYVGTSAIAYFGGQSYSATVPSQQVCAGYGFYTVGPSGNVWFNIAETFEDGMAMASGTFSETYVPSGGVQCIPYAWHAYGDLYYWNYIGNIYDWDYDGPPMG